MLQTLPQSLRQKLQPRVVAGMPGDALRRQAQAQVSGGNPAGAIATLREGVARYRTILAAPRPGPAAAKIG